MRHLFEQLPRFDILLAVSLGLTILGFVIVNMMAK
jgi:hypothetical protein